MSPVLSRYLSYWVEWGWGDWVNRLMRFVKGLLTQMLFFMGFLASCCTSLVSSLLIRQWWQYYKGQKQSCKCCKHTSKQNWYFEDFTAPGDYSLIQQKPRIVTNWWALTASREGREGLGMSISESDLSQARPYYTGVKCAKNYRTSFASSDKIADEF